MLTDEQVFEIISREFKDKILGVTGQYLDIHQPGYVNGKIQIARIDRSDPDVITAYLPVVDEYFYFSVYLSPLDGELWNISTTPGITASFTVTSEDLTIAELEPLIKFKFTRKWNKGDLRTNGKAVHKFTMMEFEADKGPDNLEGKLIRLLDVLEQDVLGLSRLQQQAETYVHCVLRYHYGNQLLGAFAIEPKISERLAKLNLIVRFDISAWGEPFRP